MPSFDAAIQRTNALLGPDRTAASSGSSSDSLSDSRTTPAGAASSGVRHAASSSSCPGRVRAPLPPRPPGSPQPALDFPPPWGRRSRSTSAVGGAAPEKPVLQRQMSSQRTIRSHEGTLRKFALEVDEVPGDHECAICYQRVRSGAVTLACADQGCLSYFHVECICPWLERNPSCPLCRCEVKEVNKPSRTPTLPQPLGGPCPLEEALLAELDEESRPWLRRTAQEPRPPPAEARSRAELRSGSLPPAASSSSSPAAVGRPPRGSPTSLPPEHSSAVVSGGAQSTRASRSVRVTTPPAEASSPAGASAALGLNMRSRQRRANSVALAMLRSRGS